MRDDPLIAKLRVTLEKSLGFVKAETPSKENVTELHTAMSSVANAIATGQ